MLVIRVLLDDNLTPYSSDKILSAAITRMILLPTGVRMPRDNFHLGVVRLA